VKQVESKEYSWKWVTADELLSHGPCELLYAMFIPSAAATATATIYNGENTNGDIIVAWRTAQSKQAVLSPKAPLYCYRGIFVDNIANVRGVFVQWRELGNKGGE